MTETESSTMITTERTKRAIAFKPEDAKRVGQDASTTDQIVG